MLAFRRPQFKLNRSLVILSAIVLFIFFTLIWHLSSSLPGVSPQEAATINNAASLHSIYHNPVNAPYLLVDFVVHKLGLNSLVYYRLASVVFALIFTACFYKIARTWFGKFISTIASLMFATTPLVLLAARTATPEIMFLLPLLVAGLYFYVSKSDEIDLMLVVAFIAATALCLYTPGMFWLILIGAYFVRRDLLEMAQSLSKKFLAGCLLLFVLIILPLILGSLDSPQILKTLALIPDHSLSLQTLKSSLWSIVSVFWRSSDHNLLQVGRLPLLNFTQLILVSFGIYALWSRARDKVYGLTGLILISCLAFALTGNYSIMLIGVIASLILVAAGLRYLYMEWRGVFPVNPLPRSLASFMLILIAVINIGYGIRYALVAWPNTLETKSVYVLKLQGTKGVKN